jgi:hypothetical protein
MKKSRTEVTTAKNLEERFDRGDAVLDYFEVKKAVIVDPKSEGTTAKSKSAYPGRRNPRRPAVVREKSSHYRSKS